MDVWVLIEAWGRGEAQAHAVFGTAELGMDSRFALTGTGTRRKGWHQDLRSDWYCTVAGGELQLRRFPVLEGFEHD